MTAISPVEKLASIAAQMESLVGDIDIEASHGRADDLLVEAVKWLAATQRITRESSERIVAAYERLPKWYA